MFVLNPIIYDELRKNFLVFLFDFNNVNKRLVLFFITGFIYLKCFK